jgi:predicted enzyme related to lactoylglutathione lyase
VKEDAMRRSRILLLVAAASAAVYAAGRCATSPPSATPATPPAAATAGRFVWHDLVTRDPVACQKFYGELLGWDFKDTTRNNRPYVLARSGGRYVSGIAAAPPNAPEGPAVWLPFLAVKDLEGRIEEARKSGSELLVSPISVQPYGRVAVIRDPQRAPLGLVALFREVPTDPEPVVGRFFWDEYLARDGSEALRFYTGLTGWSHVVSEERGGIAYHVLRNDRSRAGLFQIPPGVQGIEPNWLPYVRVDDPTALAARAQSLGGRVLISPSSGIRGGTLAVVTDPTGAALALQKWPLPRG